MTWRAQQQAAGSCQLPGLSLLSTCQPYLQVAAMTLPAGMLCPSESKACLHAGSQASLCAGHVRGSRLLRRSVAGATRKGPGHGAPSGTAGAQCGRPSCVAANHIHVVRLAWVAAAADQRERSDSAGGSSGRSAGSLSAGDQWRLSREPEGACQHTQGLTSRRPFAALCAICLECCVK